MNSRLNLLLFYQTLRELQKDLGEISHKKKSETKPEEIEQLLEKYDVSRIV